MNDFKEGEYIVYVNGDKYELGRIASLREDGAFVCYHEGETAAKTPYDCMHKLVNAYAIKETMLGGGRFEDGLPNVDKKMLDAAAKMSEGIEYLGLSVRVYNAVRRWGINTVAELWLAYSKGDLPRIRNLGGKSIEEIKHVLVRRFRND